MKGLKANNACVLVMVCVITRCTRLVLCGGTNKASITLAINAVMLRTPQIVKIITDNQSSFVKMARVAQCCKIHEGGLVI